MGVITRRRALELLGMGAVSAAAAACSRPVGPTPAPASPPVASPPPAPDSPDWPALRARLLGGLLLPEDRAYPLVRRSYNALFDERRPAAIARCTATEDVQACMDFARRHAIPIAARSGGHGYAGHAVPQGGLVVDLRALDDVRMLEGGLARVGAGARLIDVQSVLAANGRCLASGSCASVGIAGITLGGGIGLLSRLRGLTCDALRAAEIVLPDGSRRVVDEGSDADLFWALRGGGGGNFGIVTSLTFAPPPASPVGVFSLRFPAGAAADVLAAWQRFMADAPRELGASCVIHAGTPPTCSVDGCFSGARSLMEALLDDLISRTRAKPLRRRTAALEWMDAVRYFAGCQSMSIEQCHVKGTTGEARLDRMAFVASSRIVESPVADATLVVQTVNGRRGIDLIMDALGGAVADAPPDATAFPHRKASAVVQVFASTSLLERESKTREVASVRDALGSFLGNRAYVNYLDPTMPDWAAATYGANLPRLRDVAHRHDPDRVLAFPQSIA